MKYFRRTVSSLLSLAIAISSVGTIAAYADNEEYNSLSSDIIPVSDNESEYDSDNYIEIDGIHLPINGLADEISLEAAEGEEDRLYAERTRGDEFYIDDNFAALPTNFNYASSYIYNTFTDEEKQFYNGLTAGCEAVLNSTKDITNVVTWSDGTSDPLICTVEHDLTKERAKMISSVFKYCNPQYYFISQTTGSGTRGSRYCFHLLFSNYQGHDFTLYSERYNADKTISSVTGQWLSDVSGISDPVEKEMALVKKVCDYITYDDQAIDEDDAGNPDRLRFDQNMASGLLTGTTVCAGYSKLTAFLCNAAGLECFSVTSKDHEWNLIKLYDNWYQLDSTWYDSSGRNKKWINKSYSTFNANDTKNHHKYLEGETSSGLKWSAFTLPECVNDEVQVASKAIVTVDKLNFPDENFRNYILYTVDTDHDGELSDIEINAVTSMDISNCGISSLKGIEYFTELVSLDAGSYVFGPSEMIILDDIGDAAEKYVEFDYYVDLVSGTNLVQSDTAALTIPDLTTDSYESVEGVALEVTGSKDGSDVSKTFRFSNNNGVWQLNVLDQYTPMYHDGEFATFYFDKITKITFKLSVSKSLSNNYKTGFSFGNVSVKNAKGGNETVIFGNSSRAADKTKTATGAVDNYGRQINNISYLLGYIISGCSYSQNNEYFYDKNGNVFIPDYVNRLTSIDLSSNTKMQELNTTGNMYDIGEVTGEFALSDIPGFDPAKASDWIGAVYFPDNDVLSYIYSQKVTYNYDCGNGITVTFTLVTPAYHYVVAEVTSSRFPDAKFRSYVQSNIDTDGDGKLNDKEIDAVTEINVRNSGISDLTGIELFTNLETLNCGKNSLKALNVRSSALTYLDCSNNEITSLDLTGMPALEYLDCSNNKLSGNIITIKMPVEGEIGENLYLEKEAVIKLPTLLTSTGKVPGSVKMQVKGSSDGTDYDKTFSFVKKDSIWQINVLDRNTPIYRDGEFATFYFQVISEINFIITTDEPADVITTGTQVSNYDGTGGTVNFGKGSSYESKIVGDNGISNPAYLAAYAFCNGKKTVTSLYTGRNSNLSTLNCSINEITALDISYNKELTALYCSDNKLTSLDVSDCEKLTKFSASGSIFDLGQINGSYSLSQLPGFDTSKASKWSGALYDSSNGTLKGFTDSTITYKYDCGNGKSVLFTLTADVIYSDPMMYVTPGDCEVTLTWTEVKGADKYKVYYVLNGKSTAVGNVSGLSKTVTGLTNGTEYGFYVRAFIDGVVQPAPKVYVLATPRAPSIKAAAGDKQVKLTWEPVDGAAKYKVYKIDDGTAAALLNVAGTTYTVTGLTNGTRYGFYVRAIIDGQVQPAGDTVYATPEASEIPKPTITAEAGDGQVKLTWEAVEGAAKYKVYKIENDTAAALLNVAGTTYTVTGLTNGTEYGFYVRAIIDGKAQEAGNTVYATPEAPAVSEPTITAVAGDKQVKLTWQAVDGAAKYKIYKIENGTAAALLNAAGTSYTVTGLMNGTEYGFYVRAIIDSKVQPAGDTVYATPLAAEPTITAEAGNGQVKLTWKAVDGAAKYKVYKIENGTAAALLNVAGTSYTVTGLVNGTEYGFYVRAIIDSKVQAAGDTVYATPKA